MHKHDSSDRSNIDKQYINWGSPIGGYNPMMGMMGSHILLRVLVDNLVAFRQPWTIGRVSFCLRVFQIRPLTIRVCTSLLSLSTSLWEFHQVCTQTHTSHLSSHEGHRHVAESFGRHMPADGVDHRRQSARSAGSRLLRVLRSGAARMWQFAAERQSDRSAECHVRNGRYGMLGTPIDARICRAWLRAAARAVHGRGDMRSVHRR